MAFDHLEPHLDFQKCTFQPILAFFAVFFIFRLAVLFPDSSKCLIQCSYIKFTHVCYKSFYQICFLAPKIQKNPKNGQFQPYLSFFRHISRVIGVECQNIIILNECKLVSPYFTVEHPKHDEGNLSKTFYGQKCCFSLFQPGK